jgi:hypothetical protein
MPAMATAQDQQTGTMPPPFVSRLDGAASVTRNARIEEALAQLPVLDGDRLVTTAGRLAIQWPDGVVVAMAEGTTVDAAEARAIRVDSGEVRVIAPDAMDSFPFGVITRHAALRIARPGTYVVSVDDGVDGTVFAALEGEALVSSERGDYPLTAGLQVEVRYASTPVFSPAEPLATTEFAQWALAAAGDVLAPAPSTASYLPADLRMFAPTLHRHGDWVYDQGAGYVWYPRVGAAWQPYSVGVWIHGGYFGWAWVGADPWAWPTHHYGGWGIGTHGRWFWRPHHHWAPARVSWAIGPGYVAWCPLDWMGRPVFPAPFAGFHVRAGIAIGHALNPFRGWVTVRSRSFGARTPAHRLAIDARQLPEGDLRAFVARPTGPPRTSGQFVARHSGPRTGVPASGMIGRRRTAVGPPTGIWASERPGAIEPFADASRDTWRSGIDPSATRAADQVGRQPEHPAYAPDPYSPEGRFGVVRGADHPAYAPDPYTPEGRRAMFRGARDPFGPRVNPLDGRAVFASPYWPGHGGRFGESGPPHATPYDRATPFLNPQWTNRGRPFTAGLPQIGPGGAVSGGSRSGAGRAPGAIGIPVGPAGPRGASPHGRGAAPGGRGGHR